MSAATQFSFRKFVLFVVSFSFSVSRIFLTLFSFILAYLFRKRWRGSGGSMKSDFEQSEVITEEINEKVSEVVNLSSELEKAKTEEPILGLIESENDRDEEEEKVEFSFEFKFPTLDEFIKSQKEKSELVSSASISRCEFVSEKIYIGFIKEPDVLCFDIKQTNVDCSNLCLDSIVDDQIFSDGIVEQVPAEAIGVINDDSRNDESIDLDWESESISFEHSNSDMMSPSISDGFLSDDDFGGEFEINSLMDTSSEKSEMEKIWECGELIDEEKEDSYILEELRKIEEDQINADNGLKSGFLSEQDFDKSRKDVKTVDNNNNNGSYDSEKVVQKETSSAESEDANELETLWEHQELIEQLKMELKKVRATGLPTILEESESTKITEDLKPWKINEEKFQHGEFMDELHKFYKTYRERMRKFDIFNYQKMYAMGFLQLKDPLTSISRQKFSGPALKSLLSQKNWNLNHRICDSDPMVKFMKELKSDLEVVYVGQMCLSWEFLHWQYGKTLDLWESDPRLIHQYNEVAGEFQQFQVILQRFIEDDPFQGPRVQHYTKSRCVNRYLLQIPVIKEDKKDKRRGRKGEKGQHAITSDMLVEMMEESIRILWRFIRTDKDACSVTVKSHKAKPTDQLHNPDDLEILTEIRKILQKKERKLKEVWRSGNCILKRFRMCREEDDRDQVLYFFSQVDMKLVHRVLNMAKLSTEQLVWCHSKLSNISFEQRKIQVEPSFLLFPC